MSAQTARDLAAFRETRRQYLGGTDMAAITGVSKWAGPVSVYLDKIGHPDEDEESLVMRRGIALERIIAEEFEHANPGLVTYKPRPIVRTDWGFPAGASVDFMVAELAHPRTPVAGLECKTAFRFGWRDWDEETADLPDAYYVQVQWYLAVTELPMFYSAADVGDERLRIVPVVPDLDIQATLIEAGREFWTRHVERGVPPQPIGLDADGPAIRRLFPETIPDPAVTIEDDAAEVLLSDYLAHKFKAEEAKRAAETAKQQLCVLMGEHERAVVGRWLLSWKPQERTTIDSARLRAERPDIAAAYSKTSESRTFAAPKEIT
jgi:predicted phage-related endonuclease